MAKVSGFYQESEVTFGTHKYKISVPLNTIYSVDDDLDLSVAQSAWNKTNEMFMGVKTSSTNEHNIVVPILKPTNFKSFKHYISNKAPTNSKGYNLSYSPSLSSEKINMYPVILLGSTNCHIGTKYLTLVTPYVTTSNLKVLTDFKYNEVVCIAPSITGWKKSEFNFDNMYSSGNITTATNIPWDDFINAPDDYYISSFNMPNTLYFWNGTKFDQSKDSLNYAKAGYIINGRYLKTFSYNGLVPSSGYGEIKNYTGSNSGDTVVPSAGTISLNNNTDGFSSRLPFGLWTNNSTFGNIFCYSFIDYTPIETHINFDAMDIGNPDMEVGTFTLDEEIIEGKQFRARLQYKYTFQKTAETRYGYTNIFTDVRIAYEGKPLYDLLSGLGLYFVKSSSDLTGVTPDTLQNSSNIYLGEMDEAGYTTCRFITGKELEDYKGYNSNGGYVNNGFDPGKKPSGGGDEDEVNPMEYGNGSAIGGFATYYLVTDRDLRVISQEIAAHSPAGYSFEKNIASLYGLCNNGAKFLNVGESREIILSGGSDPATVETGVTAPQVAGQKSIVPIGGLSLTRPHENFLDYEPYTEVEIFVPLCGWTKIPAYCLGHYVSVNYLVDATTCSIRGIISCDGVTVAEMQGVFGSSVPFTSIQSGLKNGAQIQSLIGAVTNVGLMGVGIAMENPLLVAGGASGLISNVTQTAVTAQSNYVSTVGSMGDKTAFGNGIQCQYKITTPLEDIPSDYGARIGFVVNKAMTISAGMGFTVLSDPLINASCTDSEREELRELLQKGVIF